MTGCNSSTGWFSSPVGWRTAHLGSPGFVAGKERRTDLGTTDITANWDNTNAPLVELIIYTIQCPISGQKYSQFLRAGYD